MLLPNPRGDYQFLAGIEPYSSGVVAGAGHEIVRVALADPAPYREGFGVVERHLRSEGRPRQALCAIELRTPAPFTRSGFVEFNRGYCAILEEWDLLVDGRNPVARTNVAPAWAAPIEPSLFAFCYTRPAPPGTRPTFVVAGAGELGPGSLLEAPVVRSGETSADAMQEKAAHVIAMMSRRLNGLGASWQQVTATSVYTLSGLDDLAGPILFDRIGPAAARGLTWYPARPPIDELAFEMDARGTRVELQI